MKTSKLNSKNFQTFSLKYTNLQPHYYCSISECTFTWINKVWATFKISTFKICPPWLTKQYWIVRKKFQYAYLEREWFSCPKEVWDFKEPHFIPGPNQISSSQGRNRIHVCMCTLQPKSQFRNLFWDEKSWNLILHCLSLNYHLGYSLCSQAEKMINTSSLENRLKRPKIYKNTYSSHKPVALTKN